MSAISGNSDYDVVIAGGGPGGATLAAMLRRLTSLRVALYEKEFFPREHIGESLIPRLMVLLERSGALGKVLASECWVGKSGGYFAWDPDGTPLISFFQHAAFLRDGVHRWALHVNRSEFDKILLEHARDLGTEVFEGIGVQSAAREGDTTLLTLDDGTETRCRIFVDASGRQTSVVGRRRAHLSGYRNIAIWNHFVGALPPQSIEGDWNIFRGDHNSSIGPLSPIGNFVCDDGWFWYIPVRKPVMGRRIVTHSVGLVTDPEVLKQPGKRYTEMETFLAKCRQVPGLRELMADAQPISDKVHTATNYSMFSDQLCDYDEGWLLVGDVAFFVDPLFSSGVTLAASMGTQAAYLIAGTFDSSLSDTEKRDLWSDYHTRFTRTGRTLALMIDQWYHAVGRYHPGSVYTRHRGAWPTLDLREESFPALLNLSILDILFDLGVPASERERWAQIFLEPSPFFDPEAAGEQPGADAQIRLRPGVTIRPGGLLGSLPLEVPAEYWQDPVRNGDRYLKPVQYYRCRRFCDASDLQAPTVPFFDGTQEGTALFERLSAGPQPYGALSGLPGPQVRLIGELLRAQLVTASAPGRP